MQMYRNVNNFSQSGWCLCYLSNHHIFSMVIIILFLLTLHLSSADIDTVIWDPLITKRDKLGRVQHLRGCPRSRPVREVQNAGARGARACLMPPTLPLRIPT